MGHQNRPTTANVNATSYMPLPNDPRSYQFYQLIELLFKQMQEDPDSRDWEYNGRLLFSSNPSLGFAANDIHALSYEDNRYHLEANFLGLSGAHSPLPGFLLEDIATEDEYGTKRLLLDFFAHHSITIAYLSWRKYRYYIRFQAGAMDRFSQQVFSLVGLNDPNLRGDVPINWCKMLSYTGVLASRSRSPQMVSGIIAHYFDLETVRVEEWRVRTITIPQEQQLRLGVVNSTLGEDGIIGSQVRDCTSKFAIGIKQLTLKRFFDFLPQGKDHQTLCILVKFVLRHQMAFDLELEIQQPQVPVLNFMKKDSHLHGNLLGWTSFIGQSHTHRSVRIQVRH